MYTTQKAATPVLRSIPKYMYLVYLFVNVCKCILRKRQQLLFCVVYIFLRSIHLRQQLLFCVVYIYIHLQIGTLSTYISIFFHFYISIFFHFFFPTRVTNAVIKAATPVLRSIHLHTFTYRYIKYIYFHIFPFLSSSRMRPQGRPTQ